MMRAIVTGATSFIGIALTNELIQNGYYVTAVTRPGNNRCDVMYRENPSIEIVECDISDFNGLRDHINIEKKNLSFDVFYHVAWSSDFYDPRYNLQGQMRNVDYTLNAMRAASELGCRKFLVVGSQAECGLVNEPISSKTADNPITAYAAAKCETYYKCCESSDKLGIDLFWPRLLSAYGPYDRKHTLVMSCINACINRCEIALTKAEQIWDYVYVGDVAKALRIITEEGKPKKKYTIASGVGRPLREYIQDIADVYEYQELMNGIGKRPYADNEVMYLAGDISEMEEDTGIIFDADFKKHLPIPYG